MPMRARRRLRLGTDRRRPRGLARHARPQRARRRRRHVGEVVGRGPALRAADSAGLQRLRHRSGRRLPRPRGATRGHGGRPPRSAAIAGRRGTRTAISGQQSGDRPVAPDAAGTSASTSAPSCPSSTRCGAGPACRIGSSSTRRTTSSHDADADQLLDLDGHGYTFVTYQASRLPAALLAATEAIIVTRESDPREIAALRAWCQPCRPPIRSAGTDWPGWRWRRPCCCPLPKKLAANWSSSRSPRA